MTTQGRRDNDKVRYLFGGVNNRLDGAPAPVSDEGVISDLEAAENVCITNTYGIRTRPGSTTVTASGPSHSIWSDGDTALFVGGNALNRHDAPGEYTVLAPLVNGGERMFYINAGTAILYSNGLEIGAVLQGVAASLQDPGQAFKQAFPPARHLAWFNGRVYGATRLGLVYSDTYRFESIDERNFLIPLGTMKMVAPVSGGIYVSFGNRTVFLQGTGPEDFVVRNVNTSPVIDGAYALTDARHFADTKNGDAVVFATKAGLFVGFGDGSVQEITRGRYLVGDRASGSVFIHEQGPQVHIYTSLVKE